MTSLKLHRTYRFIDKDPVIDEIRTLVQDEGLMKKLNIIHELSGVSATTLDNWFNGETKSPQNRTVCAVTSALGYKRKWQRDGDFDVESELKIARAWNKRHEKRQQETQKRVASRRKPNGNHKERRASLS